MEMILWENVAYLADDDRRAKAFGLLREKTGLEPERILVASDDDLLEVARYGIVPDQTVAKLRRIAQVALTSFPDGIESALQLPVKQAVKAFKQFPAIGEPGAERILMLTGAFPVFGLESNSLRVLQRLGFGQDTGRFDADYKAAQSDALQELPPDSSVLATAYLALRRHGQTVCRRTTPLCNACPLRTNCPSAAQVQSAS
jgi:endonuclease III